MRLSSRTWFLISLVLMAAAVWAWRQGDAAMARRQQARPNPPVALTNPPAPRAQFRAPNAFPPLLTRLPSAALTGPGTTAVSSVGEPIALAPDARFPHRLQNTTKSMADLGRSDQALLLRNALWDTGNGVPLAIPDHLKAAGGAGSYIVQARGPMDDGFRAALSEAGARVVAYIPNNAYLVRLEEAQADRLRGVAQIVVPYEPYYKLDGPLLALAVEQQALASGQELVLGLFPDAREGTLDQVRQMGVEVVREDRSPFGPLLYVKPPPDTLVALAQLPGVQNIEISHPRALLNDLTRTILSVTPDTVASNNYLGLTGSNVVVNVNDTGVDPAHPDLAGRVLTAAPAAADDFEGHGTHVAGTIASSGVSSSTVTNAYGSLTNASFRGMAPGAKIFPLRVFLGLGPEISDTFVQETVAASNLYVFRRTNAIVSNNSWGYITDSSYNLTTASYDAAVRDALPEVAGLQPILYVFAAGNNGFGNDNGQGGIPGTIVAPGTGKNVITVTASESNRGITNELWAPFTDSRDQIASFASRGPIAIGIEGPNGRFKPDLTAPGTFIVSTRAAGWESGTGTDLDQLNEGLAPHYRYESGTSMATPSISGLLALMQEFFEQVLKRSYSPALFKALLINGARSVGPLYDLSPQGFINYQGWGLANLTNSLPSGLTNATQEASWPMRFIDQSPTNALGTGQSRSWQFRLAGEAFERPLRITVAWTDPPGNPAASIKLVNDLDLVVTNLDTGEVYVGNNIPFSSDFSAANPTNDTPGLTNALPAPDYVNNVENVFLREARGSNFVVTVSARRVNVNALPSDTTNVVQDFALVISSSVEPGVQAFQEFRFAPLLSAVEVDPPVQTFTNGVPILNQHAGAQFPLTNSTYGDGAQWRFYRFDNSLPPSELSGLTNGSNVAFITFIPPNLSKARSFDADIDLYVSRDASLTNLEPAAMAAAFRSVNPGGTEVVFFTNGTPADIFYVGVKAEDQMAAEFGIVGLSTDIPFDEVDEEGNRTVNALPVGVEVSDGSPELPSATYQFGIVTEPLTITRVVVTNIIYHEQLGDLYGHLSHGNAFTVLNNHRSGDNVTNTLHTFIYDDSDSGEFLGGGPTDGPGSLADFVGREAFGLPFVFAMSDNALNHTGRVESLRIRLEPNLFDEDGITDVILPGAFKTYFVDVPSDATKLSVFLSNMSGPLHLYLRKDVPATSTEYAKFGMFNPPSGVLAIGLGDVPPLTPGRWFVSVFNPNSVPVSYHIAYAIERGLPTSYQQSYTSEGGPFPIPDDVVSRFTLSVTNARPITSVSAGLRIEHPRAADLSVRLLSPWGQRVLLVENRGGLSTNGFGAGTSTNLIYTGFTDNTNLSLGPIKFAVPPYGTNTVPYTNRLSDFEGLLATNYFAGSVVDGWQVLSNQVGLNMFTNVAVLHRGAQAHGGTNVLALERGRIYRELSTVAGRQYLLRFYYSGLTASYVGSRLTLGDPKTVQITNINLSSTSTAWKEMVVRFAAPVSGTPIEIKPSYPAPGMLLDDFELIEFGGTQFYTPEESLEPFEAQPGIGDWQLEILDSRVGLADTAPNLISWQLNFVFAPTNPPAITLTNGVPYAGTVTGSDTDYFIVEVPLAATLATNVLSPTSGGDVVLLYNENGLPDGSQLGDVQVDFGGPGGDEILILDTINPPQLVPGQRYYLGVRNFQPSGSSDYTLLVQFDRTDSNFLNVPMLTNGVARNAQIPVTNLLDYYQFDVSSLAEEVRFDVVPNGGNVSLFVRKYQPVGNPLPLPTLYDYASQNPGPEPETVLIVTNSFPVPVSAGVWYVGVLNVDTQPVPYTITATELGSAQYNVIPLSDGVALTATNALTNQLFNVFQLRTDTGDPGVLIELSQVSEAARLHVDLDRVPRPGNALGSLSALPGQTAAMIMRTNRLLPTLNGDLNIVVEGLGTNDLEFTLRVTRLTNAAPPVLDLAVGADAAGRVAYNPFEPEIAYYRFQASTNVRWIDVQLTPGDGNVDLVVKRGLPPTLAFYSYASTNLALTNDVIRIDRLSVPDPAEGGDWYVGVVNREQTTVAYSLRIDEVLDDAELGLADGVPLATAVLPRATDHFRIPVSAEATKATVQVDVLGSVSVHVIETFLKKDLPYPSFADYDYLPFLYQQTQLFEVATNTWPEPLSVGDWYLTVGNLTDLPVGYRVTYVAHTNDLALSTNLISPVVYQTATNTVIAWYSRSGRQYFVEGSTNSANGPWTAVSGTITAGGTQALRILPLATPYQFFRVVEGTAPAIVIADPALLPDGSLTFTWNGYIGGAYEIRLSVDLQTWHPATNTVNSAELGTITVAPSGLPHAFYRVYLKP